MKGNSILKFINKIILIFFYRNDMQLLTMPGKRDRDFFIMQAVFGTIVVSLFMGVFLSGLYIYMGAPDSIMGYIPIIPNIAAIFLIFTASLTERVKNVKRLVIVLNFISKTLLFSAVWIPLFVTWGKAIYIMLPLTFLGFTANAIMGILVNSWFIDTIDISIRGRYMGARSVFSLVVSATLPVIAGKFLDGFMDRYFAFCIIYSVAWLFSMLESFSFYKITSPPAHEHKRNRVKFRQLISIPLANKPFMKFMLIQIFFHLIWFVSMTFAQVYEIRYMKISYTYLTLMGSIGAVVQMLLYPVWGKIIDKYGTNLIMRIALVLYMVHAGIYFFMIKGNAPIFILILNLNGAILSPAWALSTFNERFSTIPKEGRTIYDSFFATVLGLTIFIAPVLGNLLRELILKTDISFLPFPEFKLLFVLTFTLLLALNVTLLFKSKKETKFQAEKEMLKNIKYRFSRK